MPAAIIHALVLQSIGVAIGWCGVQLFMGAKEQRAVSLLLARAQQGAIIQPIAPWHPEIQ
jgi:hypothetical protein